MESETLSRYVDLAQPRLGATVLSCSDEFFAPARLLIEPSEPVFIPDKFTDQGKWMDGWESRRKRTEGYDWCILKICRGVVRAVNIDTTHFDGNQPDSASIEAADCIGKPDESTEWHEIVPRVPLAATSQNKFDVATPGVYQYLRLNIFPDGGVARLRVYGEVHKDWNNVPEDSLIDLAAMVNGGVAQISSDSHFGNMQNLNAPGRAVNMGDGWETRRRRGEGFDWAILKLGHPGTIQKLIVDTQHFKGNYPARFAVRGIDAPGKTMAYLMSEDSKWQTVIPETPAQADHEHVFCDELEAIGPFSHVKLEIFPDGGVARLRVYGRPSGKILSELKPEPLTAEAFAPFGDVIDISEAEFRQINDGFADRFENLTNLDIAEQGSPALSIFRSRPILLPFRVERMERHPLASQAFLPAGTSRFLVLVGGNSDTVTSSDLRLFVTNGRQGINFRRGVWHHFNLLLDQEQCFYVIDRSNPDANTEEVDLDKPVLIPDNLPARTD